MLQRPAVLQISRNSGGTKGVAASGIGQGGGLGPPLDHMQHIKAGHRPLAEPIALAHAAEERSFLVAGDSGRRDPVVQVPLETRMAGHLVALALAAFLVQPEL